VLIATQAQETRDLIRILADVFKTQGASTPIITAADFRLDDDKTGIAALLDSVSNQHHANLREKAQRNLSAVLAAVKDPKQSVPHLAEIVGALWLRSLSIKNAGAEPSELQVDITRAKPIDDNAFAAELATIVDNSFNIHPEGARYVFREEENPRAKLVASARNDKLFADGRDKRQLAREVRYVIGGDETAAAAFRVVVLSPNWTTDPWGAVEERDLPSLWDERIPLLVLPEPADKLEAKLGTWLRDRLEKRRNAVRFLVPREGSANLFFDRDLIVLARVVVLADEWKAHNAEYKKLHQKYERELRDILKRRFDRFAVLAQWNYQNPSLCKFHIESHKAEGAQIPASVDSFIAQNLFVSEDFDDLVLAASEQNESVGKLMRELQEPRPGGQECIPWLGETHMKEKLLRCCARGDVAINVRNMELLQRQAGEDEETAWKRMRGKLGTGKHLDETYLQRPQQVPHADGFTTSTTGGQLTTEPDGSEVSWGAPPSVGESGGVGSPPSAPPPGGIFGGVASPTLKPLSTNGATSALNLLGKVESWGITTGTQVQDIQLKVANLTGAQLNELLKKLPDGITYELTLNKEEK
jgi:predicted metal-dependent hydrolase